VRQVIKVGLPNFLKMKILRVGRNLSTKYSDVTSPQVVESLTPNLFEDATA